MSEWNGAPLEDSHALDKADGLAVGDIRVQVELNERQDFARVGREDKRLLAVHTLGAVALEHRVLALAAMAHSDKLLRIHQRLGSYRNGPKLDKLAEGRWHLLPFVEASNLASILQAYLQFLQLLVRGARELVRTKCLALLGQRIEGCRAGNPLWRLGSLREG